jgi:hypothetical protein
MHGLVDVAGKVDDDDVGLGINMEFLASLDALVARIS